MASKYDPLSKHLESLDVSAWQTNFREIERILGFSLPASARNHRSWWHNNTIGHPQAPAWMDIGWKTADVDMGAGTLVFRRSRSSAHRSGTPAIRASRVITPLSSMNPNVSSPHAGRPSVIPAKAGIQRGDKITQPAMTTIKRPNRDALNQALDVYRDAMRTFIIRYLNRFKKEQVEQYIRHSLGGQRYEEFNRRLYQNSNEVEATIDINDFPSLLGNPYRSNIFGQSLKYDRVVEDELRWIVHARNRAAHPGTQDLESKYAEISMSSIATVLGRINALNERRLVESIKDRLLSILESPQQKSHSILRAPKSVPLHTRETPVTFDVDRLMSRLSRNRPLFHSEADFQHSIESLIQETMPSYPVRLMHQLPHEERSMYLDIWLPNDGMAIQLRHATQKLELDWEDVSFELKAHGAQDITRYDFLRDVQRLEHTVARVETCKVGLAILLTNDPLYWKTPHRAGTIDAAFRVHEGRELTGELGWAAHAGAGTTRSREAPIRLQGSYTIRWRDYSKFEGEKYGEFRYLAVAVQ